jgi:tRNA(Ile)-lysidine synthase
MHQNFRDYLHENLPFLIGKKIFVAVSGGLDSMVLLDLVSTIDFEIAVLHCNFNLRGHESLDDENFVRKNCIAKNINFFIKNFDTRHFAQASKLSTQVAARKLRYKWFNEKLEQEKFDL